MAPHIGTRVRQARLDFGRQRGKRLSQEELAHLAGVTLNTISRIEQGQNPQVETLTAIARVLGVSADWLLGLSEDSSAREEQDQTNNDYWRAVKSYLERFSPLLV